MSRWVKANCSLGYDSHSERTAHHHAKQVWECHTIHEQAKNLWVTSLTCWYQNAHHHAQLKVKTFGSKHYKSHHCVPESLAQAFDTWHSKLGMIVLLIWLVISIIGRRPKSMTENIWAVNFDQIKNLSEGFVPIIKQCISVRQLMLKGLL